MDKHHVFAGSYSPFAFWWAWVIWCCHLVY